MKRQYFCPHCGTEITDFVNDENRKYEKRAKRRASADKAQASRTKETFARQGQTIRDTIKRKNLLFARLTSEAKERGEELTEERISALMEQATVTVREELKAEREQLRKSKIRKV